MAETTARLLLRILEEPGLVPAVQALDPPQLHALVRAVGIADAGELLAMATHEQFARLVDESLWTQDGTDESFDHRNFPTWLEVMGESGDAFVVERLHALPEETLVLAFSGQLLVLDVETLGMGMAGASAHAAQLAEKALDAALYLEFHDYTLVARREVGWDAVVSALLALDAKDHALVERILDACCRASTEYIDDNGGLYEVLSAAEAIEEDAHADRQARRAKQGYVDPRDAAAFMRLAEDANDVELPDERDAITRAYFRDLDEIAEASMPDPTRLTPLLRELGVAPVPRPALPSVAPTGLRAALAELSTESALARERELVYLANVLVASGRGFSPVGAAQEAVRLCTRGLEHLTTDGRDPAELLENTTCDRLFRLGLAAETRDESRPTGRPDGLRDQFRS
jgi:hypothetical protein